MVPYMSVRDAPPIRHRPGPAVSRGWAGAAALVVVCGLAATLALRHLGTKPLWLDERMSREFADRSPRSLLHAVTGSDADAALYYVILHAWLHLGRTARWMRGLSVLFGVGAVAATGWCGVRWRGWPTGLAAAVALGVSPFWLYYAQEARTYTLVLLLGVMSSATLLGALRRPDPRSLVAYGIVTTLLLYASLFAVVFVAAQAVVVTARGHGRRLAPAWAVAGLLALPLAWWQVTVQSPQITWIARPTVGALWSVVRELGGGWVGVAAFAALVVWAGRSRHVAPDGDEFRVTLAAAAVAPVLAQWAVSQVVPVFVDRYLIASLGAGALLVGDAVARLWETRRRALALVLGLALVAVWLVADVRIEAAHTKVLEDRGAAHGIAAGCVCRAQPAPWSLR